MTRRMTSWAACLRILCALALLSVGFAHQPASAARPGAILLSQYVLPDGTIGDLCLNDHVDGKVRHDAAPKCEACRIGGAMLLPQPADPAGTVLAFRTASVRPLVGQAVDARRERPGAPPRAPPFRRA
ncbi:hypothetical protein [Shinella sp.]|uniref:hypothetical protein n=1 Tax=Shinella sp. TaxID=1870904 RepID=UPI00301C3D65